LRIRLILESEYDFIKLPLHHNIVVQGMLYKNLPESLSSFLHELGFFYKGRRFKLFTFSKINSDRFVLVRKNGRIKDIKYKTPIALFISSGISDITKNWGKTFLNKEKIKLGKNELFLDSIEVLQMPKFREQMIIKTLSPITVYRTFTDGKKYYRYYSPIEPEFEVLLKENLRKKYHIITGIELTDFPFEIKPYKNIKKVLFKYKNFPIEAYEGVFQIKTDPEIFKKVYDAGLGAKNSQGFGMIEVVENGKKRS